MNDGWYWSLAVAVGGQLIAFGALYGGLRARVVNVEKTQESQARLLGGIPERLARIETILERLERTLADRRAGP